MSSFKYAIVMTWGWGFRQWDLDCHITAQGNLRQTAELKDVFSEIGNLGHTYARHIS
jgi:hypothetical protein